MTASDKSPLIITVVRDPLMYDKCIAHNHYLKGCQLLKIDNTINNETIPILYNRAIANCQSLSSRWLVFAHEDFETQEALSLIFEKLDQRSIWGPIGAVTTVRWPELLGGYYQSQMRGIINTCWKDGSNKSVAGKRVAAGYEVETLDCMFLAIHGSLLERSGLRFDENLTFDLYAEDFSMNAKFNHNITTRILPRLSTFDKKTPAVAGVLSLGLHHTPTFPQGAERRIFSVAVASAA